MNIHFSLRKQGKANPVIILQVFDGRFPGRKFMYSLGINAPATAWNKSKERLKIHPASGEAFTEINKHLDIIEQSVITFLSSKHSSKTLNREDLKMHLNKLKVDERKEQEEHLQKESEFFTIWQKIIDTSKNPDGSKIAPNTYKSKKQTLSIFRKFSIDTKFKPTLLNIDKTFYNSFTQYLELCGLSPNSIGKHIKEVKAFLREAEDRDYEVNQSFRKKSFRVIKLETDSTYLNEVEIKKILGLNLSPTLEKHRDIFVMACFVGARHSDWHQIHPSNIDIQNGKELLRIDQKKTGDKIFVPVHPVVRLIWDKYKGKLPKLIARNKIAEAIRDICKLAELGKVMLNGKSFDKWETISTHTARRSFATNAYLSKALDVYQIMKCTGHKTEASFLRYLKLNGKDYAMQAAESKFFNPDGWTI